MNNILLLPCVAVIVKQSACCFLRASQVSLCGHWSSAFNSHLSNKKATSHSRSTLWTFSHLSALSVIAVSINCMAVQNCESVDTFQKNPEFLKEYILSMEHHLLSLLKKVFSGKQYEQEM